MHVLFVAGFGPIVTDPEATRQFYQDAIGLPLHRDGDYLHTGAIPGVKHFALWPLADAARSCFGTEQWPASHPVPHAWVEFDVEDLATATSELENRGYTLLVSQRREPWGQTVTRLVDPAGLLVGLTVTPTLRSEA